jgi:TPP-dependent 2-oxoacid decarboxylase
LNSDLEIRGCIICGKLFETRHRYKTKTCSKQCTTTLIKQTKIKNGTLKAGGGYRENANKQYGGYYKGQWCDSRWELAFLIYHLDKGYNIEKCTEYFEYSYDNKSHKYYPDFKIDHVYYEIKGRWRQNLQQKLQSVKDRGFEINVVMRKEIEPYLDYCFKTYNVEQLDELYDGE